MRTDPRSTRAWRKLRDQVVTEEPACTLRFRGICTGKSTTADHIVPVSSRPDLALERTNLRGACKPCNDTRGRMPDALVVRGGATRPRALDVFKATGPAPPRTPRRPPVLVTGPPCSGKSTYVDQHATPGALIVCWDTIALELGAATTHPTPYRMRDTIAAAYAERLALVPTAPEAWVIRTLADPAERADWAATLGAQLVILQPPLDELMARARRRPHPGRTMRDIRAWLAAQGPPEKIQRSG